jgi:hypothetical protein
MKRWLNRLVIDLIVIPVGTMFNRRPVNVTLSYIPTESNSTSVTHNIVTTPTPRFSRQVSVPVPSNTTARMSFKKRTFSTPGMLEEVSGMKSNFINLLLRFKHFFASYFNQIFTCSVFVCLFVFFLFLGDVSFLSFQ